MDAYRLVTVLGAPVVRGWGRLRVTGLEELPETGPVVLVANHDSYWDPVALAVAAAPRRQPIRALAKDSLWRVPLLGRAMTQMGHIPVSRGAGDVAALEAAVAVLRRGDCLGIFPEGTRSLGRVLRARSGLGRISRAVPEATVVCARVTGTTDVVRFPRRPRITVEFFRPAAGQPQPGENAARLGKRLLAEIRNGAPPTVPGRRRRAEKYRLTHSDNGIR
jgi:1-acyl-sn-glycerol-3-phosphate acyltransferase